MGKYIATFEHGIQITQDDFRKVSPTLSIDEDTKIKDIFDWMKNIDKRSIELKIIETEDLKTKTESEVEG